MTSSVLINPGDSTSYDDDSRQACSLLAFLFGGCTRELILSFYIPKVRRSRSEMVDILVKDGELKMIHSPD